MRLSAMARDPAQPPSAPKCAADISAQAFEGEVIGVQTLTPRDRFRVTLHFDEPVDVVTFDSFSNMRQRVTCVIDSSGRSTEKTSDGRPHMQLEV